MKYDFVNIILTAGGPKALYKIIDQFEPDFPLPILFLSSLPPTFDDMFVQIVSEKSQLPISVVEHKTFLKREMLVSKAGYYFQVSKNKELNIKKIEPDKCFINEFIKDSYSNSLNFITIVLAGMLISDKILEACSFLKEKDYPILVQDIYSNPNIQLQYEDSLPAKIIENNFYSHKIPLEKIIPTLNQLIGKDNENR